MFNKDGQEYEIKGIQIEQKAEHIDFQIVYIA